MIDQAFQTLLQLALQEDLGGVGDVTSESIFDRQHKTKAILVSKDTGVFCGEEIFPAVFHAVNPSIKVEMLKKDGDALFPGDQVATVAGPTIGVLEGERTSINFLGFLSGIATQARRFADASKVSGRALILDTRKTLPGYRTLSKYAVRVGGATNHRMGLYDMALIKDNHIDAAGGISQAVERVRKAHGSTLKIEVECRDLADVEEALGLGVEWIMLDNMDENLCRQALALPKKRGVQTVFEASGNMNLERVGRYSAVGVDYISVGALTHSVTTFDYSLRIDKRNE
jgi:nicotinate-nucleotide pyrophosphorylase (carboxylating)